jgi:uncharacterized protein (TIGR03086 family)
MEQIEQLEQALNQAQKVIDGVKPDQMEASTPCEEWDVRALLNHMTGTVVMFGSAVTGGQPPSGGDIVGDDPAGVFRQATKANLEAWRQRGALEGTVTLPMGEMPDAFAININTLDPLIHACDLAVAIGQEDLVDQDLAAGVLAQMKAQGIDDFRVPGVFGPEAPCDDSAAAHRRLLAFTGRKV